MSSALQVEESLKDADLVIGAVLIPGALAPKLVTREMLGTMKEGSVLRRRRDRPGRLRRDVTADDARRPDLHGRRRRPLLRREHAGCGADHLDAGAHERDAAVRRGDRRARRRSARSSATRSSPGGSTSWAGGSRTRPSPRRTASSTRRSTTRSPPASRSATATPSLRASPCGRGGPAGLRRRRRTTASRACPASSASARVGKTLITANVISAARPTMAPM